MSSKQDDIVTGGLFSTSSPGGRGFAEEEARGEGHDPIGMERTQCPTVCLQFTACSHSRLCEGVIHSLIKLEFNHMKMISQCEFT